MVNALFPAMIERSRYADTYTTFKKTERTAMSRRKTIIQNDGFLSITAILRSINRFRGVRGPKYWPVCLQLMIYSSFGDPPHNNMFFESSNGSKQRSTKTRSGQAQPCNWGHHLLFPYLYIYITIICMYILYVRIYIYMPKAVICLPTH